MHPSFPDPVPVGTWDYNRWTDTRYTRGLGRQITVATPVDALHRRGLPAQAYWRFTSPQDKLTLAPRAYALRYAMLTADEAAQDLTQAVRVPAIIGAR